MQESALPIEKPRINSIDILRGVIMLIMALDHVRDFMSNSPVDPMDIPKTSMALYFTRWITHFCAPTFIFLSGTSAYLSLSRKHSKKEASRFLLTRGLWLLLLELTIISFGWQFDIAFHDTFAQVIWVIGWSMIVLSALIWLPIRYVAAFGLLLIFGHNIFDFVKSDSFGSYKPLWMFLHEVGFYQFNKYESMLLIYPLIPWVGVMALGYAFGTYFKLEPLKRKALFLKIGLLSLLLFVVLRFVNYYGDPNPWQHQTEWWRTVLSFFNVTKYPPSLSYVLMTLGVSITTLAILEKSGGKLAQIFIVYGRVPLFYYVLHIYLIHLIEIGIIWVRNLSPEKLQSIGPGSLGPFGYNLAGVYIIWLCVIVVLYFPCRWYMKYKQHHSAWWLSYL